MERYTSTRGRPTYAKLSAVKKLQARVRGNKARKTNPRRNRAKINKNSKAIARLRTKDLGGVFQRNFQQCKLTDQYSLTPTTPYAFCCNDFTSSESDNLSGGQVFGATYGTQPSGQITTSAIIVGNWVTRNPAETFGLAPEYRQWSDSNSPTVSPIQYMPLGAKYTLVFQRAQQMSNQGPVKIRIDMIRSKRQYLKSQYHDYTMPECLGAFQKMAISNASGVNNSYNPDLWTVKSRYLNLPAIDVGVQVLRIDQTKTVVLKKSFPKKNIKLHLDYVNATQKEPFHLATDPRIQEWCVVSIGDGFQQGNTGITCHMQRTIAYRDLDNKPLA